MNVSSHTVGQKSQVCSTNIFSSISFSYATTIRRPKIRLFLFYVCPPVCWQTKLFHICCLPPIRNEQNYFEHNTSQPLTFHCIYPCYHIQILYLSSCYQVRVLSPDKKLCHFHHIVHSTCKTFIPFICLCYFMFIHKTADDKTCLTHLTADVVFHPLWMNENIS